MRRRGERAGKLKLKEKTSSHTVKFTESIEIWYLFDFSFTCKCGGLSVVGVYF